MNHSLLLQVKGGQVSGSHLKVATKIHCWDVLQCPQERDKRTPEWRGEKTGSGKKNGKSGRAGRSPEESGRRLWQAGSFGKRPTVGPEYLELGQLGQHRTWAGGMRRAVGRFSVQGGK